MNQVALVGNMTDDPELRYTQSGAAVAGFTVAVSHRSKHNGERQDVTDGFFRCIAWRSAPRTRAAPSRRACGCSSPASLSSGRGRTTPATSVRPSRFWSRTSDRISSFSRPKLTALRPRKSRARSRRS
jgi:hypothetical protein